MMTTTQTYHLGDRVQVSGKGRTARWPRSIGTVTRIWRVMGQVMSVEVHWDGTHFGDQMDVSEVRPAPREG